MLGWLSPGSIDWFVIFCHDFSISEFQASRGKIYEYDIIWHNMTMMKMCHILNANISTSRPGAFGGRRWCLHPTHGSIGEDTPGERPRHLRSFRGNRERGRWQRLTWNSTVNVLQVLETLTFERLVDDCRCVGFKAGFVFNVFNTRSLRMFKSLRYWYPSSQKVWGWVAEHIFGSQYAGSSWPDNSRLAACEVREKTASNHWIHLF